MKTKTGQSYNCCCRAKSLSHCWGYAVKRADGLYDFIADGGEKLTVKPCMLDLRGEDSRNRYFLCKDCRHEGVQSGLPSVDGKCPMCGSSDFFVDLKQPDDVATCCDKEYEAEK